jgi:hypothetical protein
VLSMEAQLAASRERNAHLRENFQMVVGDNFDLHEELESLRADIAQLVRRLPLFLLLLHVQHENVLLMFKKV